MQNHNNFNRKLTHHHTGSEEVVDNNKNKFKQTNSVNSESLSVNWPLPQEV
jgi:hypothetical protein